MFWKTALDGWNGLIPTWNRFGMEKNIGMI